MLYSCFQGSGKTQLVKRHPGVYVDTESNKFDKDLDQFPANYLAHIDSKPDVTHLVCVLRSFRRELVKQGRPFILIYPEIAAKEEYLARYLRRKNKPEFIEKMMRNWERNVASCMRQKGCIHIQLRPGQFLSDVLPY